MARQQSYGAMLRQARERKGLDINTIARRLRIRADIVRAIEEADFARMPPRGYSRNMISSYARYVGLNPSQIANLYLDEISLYETGRARVSDSYSHTDSSRRSREVAEQSSRSRRTQRGSTQNRVSQHDNDLGSRRVSRQARPHTQENYLDRRNQSSAPKKSRGIALPAPSLPMRQKSQYAGGSGYPSIYSQSYGSRSRSMPSMNSGKSKPPLFLLIGIALVLVVIVALVILFGGEKQEEQELPQVPISGLTDTSSPEDDQVAQAEAIPPTSATVEYRIADQEIYAEIINGDDVKKAMLSGPMTEIVEVTGEWSFATWVTSAVTITVNGDPVEFDTTDPDTGIPIAKVSFADVLAKWEAEHPKNTDSETTEEGSANNSSETL